MSTVHDRLTIYNLFNIDAQKERTNKIIGYIIVKMTFTVLNVNISKIMGTK